MRNYRYGGFRLIENIWTIIGIAVLWIYVIISLILDVSYAFTLCPAFLATICMWQLIRLHMEQFTLQEDAIISYVWKNTRIINLPSELTLIVSCADVHIPLDAPAFFRPVSKVAKRKYSISILQQVQPSYAINMIHNVQVDKYAMSIIRRIFDGHQFIYDFVCNQHMLEQLIRNRTCSLIVPKSLLNEVCIDSMDVDLIVDEEY